MDQLGGWPLRGSTRKQKRVKLVQTSKILISETNMPISYVVLTFDFNQIGMFWPNFDQT